MRRNMTFAILASVALSVQVFAQGPNGNKARERGPQSKQSDEKGAETEGLAVPEEKVEEKSPIVLDGDKLYMKDGTIVAGGQILSQSPRGYEYSIIEGVDPFLVPLKQVDHVEKDDIDPLAERRHKAMAPTPDAQNVIAMENLSPEFAQSLAKQLPEDALTATDADSVSALQVLAEKLGVKLVVEEAVVDIPLKDRLWSYTVPAQTSFSALVEQEFVPKMPGLAVRYEMDRVVIAVGSVAAQSAQPE